MSQGMGLEGAGGGGVKNFRVGICDDMYPINCVLQLKI